MTLSSWHLGSPHGSRTCEASGRAHVRLQVRPCPLPCEQTHPPGDLWAGPGLQEAESPRGQLAWPREPHEGGWGTCAWQAVKGAKRLRPTVAPWGPVPWRGHGSEDAGQG